MASEGFAGFHNPGPQLREYHLEFSEDYYLQWLLYWLPLGLIPILVADEFFGNYISFIKNLYFYSFSF